MIVTYDLDTQPWSVGDVIVAHQAARCLAPSYGWRFNWTGRAPDNFSGVSRDHQLWHWVWGAARAFRTEGEPSEGRGDWPVDTSTYAYYRLWDIIAPHKAALPRLEPTEREWAEKFHRSHRTRAVLHVRAHPFVPNQRDSNLPAWRDFVVRIPETVVSIGDADLPGTVSARHESVERQLALIATSRWYMGASSGPAMLASFMGIPTRCFSNNVPAHPHRCWTENGLTFGDSRWFSGMETTGLLLAQYDDLCLAIPH